MSPESSAESYPAFDLEGKARKKPQQPVKNYVVSVKCVVSVKKYVVSVKCAVTVIKETPPNYSVEDLGRVVTDVKNSNYSYREAQERADLGADGQTSSENRQVNNGPERQEIEESGNY
ncbi:hypothetical protein ANN_09308 [Periplaneta americana]|uniref:Uncharacterized protein n=1 Tax=Periplaneta americana TaxID=6978 RepID=A0ABQ8TNW2_PERAM|nr:hypothetical protein ANN_09308 [Periplaneta americana]